MPVIARCILMLPECAEAERLIDGFGMEHLLADKGHDSDARSWQRSKNKAHGR